MSAGLQYMVATPDRTPRVSVGRYTGDGNVAGQDVVLPFVPDYVVIWYYNGDAPTYKWLEYHANFYIDNGGGDLVIRSTGAALSSVSNPAYVTATADGFHVTIDLNANNKQATFLAVKAGIGDRVGP